MTATFLQNELQSLIQESKRKAPETRTAAEKSLSDLKNLSITSELQLSGDLIRKVHFIDPFLFACRTRNVRLVSIAINCLQRLAAGRAIPRQRLGDVLDALREVAALSLDAQLKILQTLPALLQLYSLEIKGPLVAVALEICGALQGSKTVVVSSTAEATFQQLVTLVYDRVSAEDGKQSDETAQMAQVGSKMIALKPAAHDAFRVFADLCAMANAREPMFVQLRTLSPHFLLEVIGSISTNYSNIIAQHTEQLEICRSSLLPALTRIIAMKSTFAVLVRALRIFYVLLRQHLGIMVSDFEEGLLSIIALLEPSSGQYWRRVLSMEIFRQLCSDASFLRDLYRLYDDVEDRSDVVGTLLAAFVRIASEDPTLIGLGRVSTMPSHSGDATNGDGVTSFEASDVGGVIGGVISANPSVTGLSTEWSTVKMPCLEQLDKSDLLDIPTTYIYSLVLNCISALAEGMSKFVMPLSIPNKAYTQRLKSADVEGNGTAHEDSRSAYARTSTKTQNQNKLINPLTLDGHPQVAALSSCARLLDTCWPPILATCSTFFNAALDAEYYHNLVRAVQKLTQVSGVLELSTARDALLTTLSKAALPPNTNARLFSPPTKQSESSMGAAASDAAIVQTPQSAASNPFSQPRLSIRNLLCLRALLNLGIALGPSLGADAWFVILETLEHAESLISTTSTLHDGRDTQTDERSIEQGGTSASFSNETAAVLMASKRMFESTSGYTDETFALFVKSLFKLDPVLDVPSVSSTELSPTSPTGTPSRERMHRPTRSVSALWTGPERMAGDQGFVISKISELARMNMHRFLSSQSSTCSWQLLVHKLLEVLASQQSTVTNRLKSAEEIDAIVLEVVKAIDYDDEGAIASTAIFQHCFDVLLTQLETVQYERNPSEANMGLSLKIQAKLLATLGVVIGQCGDKLSREWTDVLELISSAFISDHEATDDVNLRDLRIVQKKPRSEAILQSSFTCLQLIISDFLGMLTREQLTELTMLLFSFGSQSMELNIALTATTFFWNVSALLLETLRSTGDRPDLNGNHKEFHIAHARHVFLLLFSRLSLLSLDNRSDIRQSSISMTIKVLEAASDQLSSAAWNTCILRMLALCSSQVKTYGNEVKEDRPSWQEAAIQTLTGANDISVHNINKIRNASAFAETWVAYLQVCSDVLDQGTLPMSTAVYKSFATMLQSLRDEDSEQHLKRSNSVLHICLDHHPADIDPGKESNQAALTQFAATLAAVFSARSDQKTDHQEVVHAIEKIVLKCVHPPYTSDAKTMAPEQEAVVALFPHLQRLLPGSTHTDLLQTFIRAPLAQAGLQTNTTFVALASHCLDVLRGTVIATLKEIPKSLDVVPILQTLAQLIATKYTALPQGGATPLWRNATTSAVQICQSAMQSNFDIEVLSRLTAAFTALAASILQVGGLHTAHGLDSDEDEAFDISSIGAIHTAISPSIGESCVSTLLLKCYMLTLFHASLIAEPFHFDLPKDITNKPLEDFSTIRPGTVRDPTYAKRHKICYKALDILFTFVAREADERPEALRLAQIAAPYLLLRCAYTYKTFMADQPLRSISALPLPLRTELLVVLDKCIELRCARETFAALVDSDNSDGKAHLRILNGLVVRLEECWQKSPRKATGVNWQDRNDGKEIEEALARWRACLTEGWETIK